MVNVANVVAVLSLFCAVAPGAAHATSLRWRNLGADPPNGARHSAANASGLALAAGGKCPTCAATADILFLVDVSGSVGPDGVAATQKFLGKLVDKMQLGRGNGQQMVGLIEFGDSAQILSSMTTDGMALYAATKKMTTSGQACANLAAAMSMVQSALMNGRQQALTKILIVVDGPVCRQSFAVQKAQQIGMYAELLVMVVQQQMGYATMQYAKEWLDATQMGGPSEGRLMTVESYDILGLDEIPPMVIPKLCPQLDGLAPPPPTYPPR